jgi:hypothetical protein
VATLHSDLVNLPHRKCGWSIRTKGRETLEQSGSGIVLELVAAFAAHSLVSGGEPGQVGV